jgi:polyisoprenoid-binding protein YceI
MRCRIVVTCAMTVLMGLAACRGEAAEPAVEGSVDRAASQVGFTVFTSMLFKSKQEGQFKEFSGEVASDPENPARTKVDLTVYTSSVDMRNKERDELLRSEDFFDVADYPTMHFVSTSVRSLSDRLLSVTGGLTIRGVTKQMTIPISVDQPWSPGRQGAAAFSTTFQIDRTEFGLNGSAKFGGLNVSVAKNVQIHMAIVVAPPRQ